MENLNQTPIALVTSWATGDKFVKFVLGREGIYRFNRDDELEGVLKWELVMGCKYEEHGLNVWTKGAGTDANTCKKIHSFHGLRFVVKGDDDNSISKQFEMMVAARSDSQEIRYIKRCISMCYRGKEIEGLTEPMNQSMEGTGPSFEELGPLGDWCKQFLENGETFKEGFRKELTYLPKKLSPEEFRNYESKLEIRASFTSSEGSRDCGSGVVRGVDYETALKTLDYQKAAMASHQGAFRTMRNVLIAGMFRDCI